MNNNIAQECIDRYKIAVAEGREIICFTADEIASLDNDDLNTLFCYSAGSRQLGSATDETKALIKQERINRGILLPNGLRA